MLDFLDRLREKPEPVRLHIAVSIAAVITGIIFFMWLSIILLQFNDKKPVSGVESTKNTSSLFSSFGSEIKGVYKMNREKVGSLLDELGTIRYESENTK